MRRRVAEGQVPPMLAEFEPTDWPGRTIANRLALWKTARHAWHEQHAWPGGAAEMIRGEREARRSLLQTTISRSDR